MRRLLGRFDAELDRVMFVDEAMSAMENERYDLVLVNRLIFADGSDALPLIERMKADERLRATPVMMVSNFQEAQDRAVAAGAVRGFGKGSLNTPETEELLRRVLAPSPG
jgi:CheY-like chemotaxis protein